MPWQPRDSDGDRATPPVCWEGGPAAETSIAEAVDVAADGSLVALPAGGRRPREVLATKTAQVPEEDTGGGKRRRRAWAAEAMATQCQLKKSIGEEATTTRGTSSQLREGAQRVHLLAPQ